MSDIGCGVTMETIDKIWLRVVPISIVAIQATVRAGWSSHAKIRPQHDVRGILTWELCQACLAQFPGQESSNITGRNAAQRRFHPTRNASTGWFKVLPAVPFSTRVSAGMKHPLGRDSSGNIPLLEVECVQPALVFTNPYNRVVLGFAGCDT